VSWVPESLQEGAAYSPAAAIFGAVLLGIMLTRFFRWALGMLGLGS
jgi:hypothetical protein